MSDTFCHKSELAVTMAAVLGACGVNAASVVVELDNVAYVSPPANHSLDFSATTATWLYDTATGVLTGSGLFSIDALFTPTNVFELQTVDPVFTAGNTASASSFTCIEGGLGVATSSHSCGGWDFGSNSINESSITYGPGTLFDRTIGGDDFSIFFPPFAIGYYDNMRANWNGTTLVFSNTKSAGSDLAFDITFTAVPIPATVWLFGSALGLLSWMRRKIAW
jgi:hypothetical protein